MIRKYESKLYIIKDIEKLKENPSNNNKLNLLNTITNSLKSKAEELKNKDNYEIGELIEYNDKNFWQVKTESSTALFLTE